MNTGDKNDDWGEETYYVVADFDSFTGQCIGFSNFYEDVDSI